jgi:Zn-dependent alcohol dehydrogenase
VLLVFEITPTLGGHAEDDQFSRALGQFQSGELGLGQPLELLGPLGCGIQTGAGAVIQSLGVEAGASIVIVGWGRWAEAQ